MPRIVITGVGSATEDHRELIQTALDSVDADGGGEVYIVDGEHLIGPQNGQIPPAGASSLQLGSNTHLRLGTGASLTRHFSGRDVVNAIVRNKDITNGNSNIRVSGGTIRNVAGNNPGRLLAFQKTHTVAVDGVRLLGVVGDWSASFIDSDNVTVSDLVIDGGTTTTEDGLHFAGCVRVAVTNCLILSGDDALSFTHSASGDTTDVVVSNLFLWSRYANALRFSVLAGQTKAIRRVRISNVVAKVGTDALHHGQGVIIEDRSGTTPSLVSDIEVDGFWLDASTNSGEVIDVDGVERVRLHRVVVWQPASRIAIDGSTDVELRDCVVDAPRGTSAQCALAGASAPVTNLRIIGGRYRNATHHAILIGGPTTGFEVSGAQIEGQGGGTPTLSGLVVAAGSNGIVTGNKINACTQSGILLSNAANTLVSDNWISNCGLWGVLEQSPSNNNTFIGNRLNGNMSGGLSIWSGSASEAIRNVAAPGVQVDDSGGFRQTIDGWFKDGGLTGLTNVEIARNNFAVGAGTAGAARFRAARDGSITAIVVTSDQNQSSGTLTVEVYINSTGLAGGAGNATALKAQLDATNRARHAVTQPKGLVAFVAGDEIYLVVSTSTAPPDPQTWAPVAGKIRCAIEIED